MGKRKKSDFINQELDNEKNDITTEGVQEDNPLLQNPVVERDYSGGENFEIRGNVIDSVEEPTTQRPIVDFNEKDDDDDFDDDFNSDDDDENDDGGNDDDDDEEEDEEEDNGGSGRRLKENEEKYYENFDEMPTKMQNELTGNLANTCVGGYVMLHNFAKQILTRDKQYYQQKALEGKFDINVLSYKVNLGDGEYSRFGDSLDNYNNVIENILTVKDETVSEMKTLVKRIAKKHGVGQSDESRLALLVGVDILSKTALLVSQVKQMNRVEANVTKLYHASIAKQTQKPIVVVANNATTQNAQSNGQQATQQQTQAQQQPNMQTAQQTNGATSETQTPTQGSEPKSVNDVTEVG